MGYTTRDLQNSKRWNFVRTHPIIDIIAQEEKEVNADKSEADRGQSPSTEKNLAIYKYMYSSYILDSYVRTYMYIFFQV